MVLETKRYVPTLAIRASEMNGLQYLPAATKERVVPCILLAPWANSYSLDKAVGRAEKAFRNQNYFLDIDRDYEFTNLESPSQQELVELLNPASSYENWCNFVDQHEWVWPCIQTRGQSQQDIQLQINRFQQSGRAYCFRVNMHRMPSNLSDVVAVLAASGVADFAIILEGGWTTDPLSLFLWFDTMIGVHLDPIDAAVPIVLSCTSMPKYFTDCDGGITPIPFSNRLLLQQIQQRRSNRSRILYGDWASTRPREPSSFGRKPIDRIDYPTEGTWNISRNKEEEWSYRDAASALISSDDWDGDLGIWGEELIQNTAISEELGIDTPQKNVAARVNIHLHRQAFYGTADLGGMNLDEDWED